MSVKCARALLTFFFVPCLTVSAAAETITLADTLGPEDLFNPLAAHALTGAQEIAYPFVPSRTVMLTSIAAALGYDPRAVPMPPTVIMAIKGSEQGLPGPTLEEFVFQPSGVFGQLHPLSEALSTTRPTLVAGHQYWFSGVTTGDQGLWHLNAFDFIGTQAVSFESRPWILQQDTLSAFRILGQPVSAPVPEPNTGYLIAIAVLLAAATRSFWGNQRAAA